MLCSDLGDRGNRALDWILPTGPRAPQVGIAYPGTLQPQVTLSRSSARPCHDWSGLWLPIFTCILGAPPVLGHLLLALLVPLLHGSLDSDHFLSTLSWPPPPHIHRFLADTLLALNGSFPNGTFPTLNILCSLDHLRRSQIIKLLQKIATPC